MILTVTPNPMLDKTLHLEQFPHGQISRTDRVLNVAGGKGINVSRQLIYLGVESVATGFLGGRIGEIINALLEKEGIKRDFVQVEDTTRIGFTVLETSTGVQTSVFEPGHRVTQSEAKQLQGKVIGMLQRSPKGDRSVEWLVCSGTVPCEGMEDFYVAILRAARETGIPVVLDTYGAPLSLGVGERPFLVKPNVKEYVETFGSETGVETADWGERAAIAALARLRGFGATAAVITDGENPAYASYGEHIWRVTPSRFRCVNATGSGDAFIAGLLYGLTKSWDCESALRFAVASGAANARRWEVACSSMAEILSVASDVRMEQLR